ncbi:MAG: YVTN family beta-propeller protein [Akkermansiaceae bacterium]|jgi:YVTN family beta-propeller protein
MATKVTASVLNMSLTPQEAVVYIGVAVDLQLTLSNVSGIEFTIDASKYANVQITLPSAFADQMGALSGPSGDWTSSTPQSEGDTHFFILSYTGSTPMVWTAGSPLILMITNICAKSQFGGPIEITAEFDGMADNTTAEPASLELKSADQSTVDLSTAMAVSMPTPYLLVSTGGKGIENTLTFSLSNIRQDGQPLFSGDEWPAGGKTPMIKAYFPYGETDGDLTNQSKAKDIGAPEQVNAQKPIIWKGAQTVDGPAWVIEPESSNTQIIGTATDGLDNVQFEFTNIVPVKDGVTSLIVEASGFAYDDERLYTDYRYKCQVKKITVPAQAGGVLIFEQLADNPEPFSWDAPVLMLRFSWAVALTSRIEIKSNLSDDILVCKDYEAVQPYASSAYEEFSFDLSGGDLDKLTDGSLVFTLTAFDGDQPTRTRPTAEINIPLPPKIISFTAALNNDGIRFDWDVENAKSVHIGGFSEIRDPIGAYIAPITQLQPVLSQYTLTAENEALAASKGLVLNGLEQVHGSPVAVANIPYSVAVSPDGTRVYVADYGWSILTMLDAQTLSPLPGSPVPVGEFPQSVATSPDGRRVYVAGSNTLTVLDALSLAPVKGSPVSVGTKFYSVAVSPDGARIYVANNDSNNLIVLDARSLAQVDDSPVSVGNSPRSVAVSSDGLRVFVTNKYSIDMTVLDAQTLTPIVPPVSFRYGPNCVVVSPDGTRVYVANGSGNHVTVLDAQTLKAVDGSPVPVGQEPYSIAISPDGMRIYVANLSSNDVTVVDARSLIPVDGSPVPVGFMPRSIAASRDGARVYVTSQDNKVRVLQPTFTNLSVVAPS